MNLTYQDFQSGVTLGQFHEYALQQEELRRAQIAPNSDINDIINGMYDTYVQATGLTYDPNVTYYSDSAGKWIVDTSDFEEGVTDVSSYYISSSDVPANNP